MGRNAAHDFTRLLTSEYRVPEDVYQHAPDAFAEKGLTGLIHLCANYLNTCARLNAFAALSII